MRVVGLKWIDASSTRGWTNARDLPDLDTVYSVGFLIKEADDYIVISSSRMSDREQFDAPLAIPRFAIQTIEDYGEWPKKEE